MQKDMLLTRFHGCLKLDRRLAYIYQRPPTYSLTGLFQHPAPNAATMTI